MFGGQRPIKTSHHAEIQYLKYCGLGVCINFLKLLKHKTK